MKAFTLTVLVIVVLGASLYLREDPFRDGRFRVYDENWQPKGYIIRDRISPGRYHIYNKDWQRQGFILKKDASRWHLRKDDKK